MIAAADQNKGFEYAKVLYDNQGAEDTGWLTGKEMATIAASVDGLDLAQWRDDVNSSSTKATASAVDKLAKQKKVTGTPTVFVGPTGGKLQVASGPALQPDRRRAGAERRGREQLAAGAKVRKERAFSA